MDSKYRIELDENSKGSMAMNSYNNLSSLDTVIKVIGVGNGGYTRFRCRYRPREGC